MEYVQERIFNPLILYPSWLYRNIYLGCLCDAFSKDSCYRHNLLYDNCTAYRNIADIICIVGGTVDVRYNLLDIAICLDIKNGSALSAPILHFVLKVNGHTSIPQTMYCHSGWSQGLSRSAEPVLSLW